MTGASSGEFTLWNGLTFNFETILQVSRSGYYCALVFLMIVLSQAHDSPVRVMNWSRNDSWMVTADHKGYVKYWQSNMNNVKMFEAHKEPVRALRWELVDDRVCLMCNLRLLSFALVKYSNFLVEPCCAFSRIKHPLRNSPNKEHLAYERGGAHQAGLASNKELRTLFR